jgi:hypothetical protein
MWWTWWVGVVFAGTSIEVWREAQADRTERALAPYGSSESLAEARRAEWVAPTRLFLSDRVGHLLLATARGARLDGLETWLIDLNAGDKYVIDHSVEGTACGSALSPDGRLVVHGRADKHDQCSLELFDLVERRTLGPATQASSVGWVQWLDAGSFAYTSDLHPRGRGRRTRDPEVRVHTLDKAGPDRVIYQVGVHEPGLVKVDHLPPYLVVTTRPKGTQLTTVDAVDLRRQDGYGLRVGNLDANAFLMRHLTGGFLLAERTGANGWEMVRLDMDGQRTTLWNAGPGTTTSGVTVGEGLVLGVTHGWGGHLLRVNLQGEVQGRVPLPAHHVVTQLLGTHDEPLLVYTTEGARPRLQTWSAATGGYRSYALDTSHDDAPLTLGSLAGLDATFDGPEDGPRPTLLTCRDTPGFDRKSRFLADSTGISQLQRRGLRLVVIDERDCGAAQIQAAAQALHARNWASSSLLALLGGEEVAQALATSPAIAAAAILEFRPDAAGPATPSTSLASQTAMLAQHTDLPPMLVTTETPDERTPGEDFVQALQAHTDVLWQATPTHRHAHQARIQVWDDRIRFLVDAIAELRQP